MVGTKPKEDENGEGKREEEKTKGLKIQDSINGIFVTFRLSNVESAKVGTHTHTHSQRERKYGRPKGLSSSKAESQTLDIFTLAVSEGGYNDVPFVIPKSIL